MTLADPLRKLKWQIRVERLRGKKRQAFPEADRGKLPVVFGNSMAKSGSHIIAQFLEGIGKLTPMVFTDQHPIRTQDHLGKAKETSQVLSDMHRLRRGDIGWGYLPARPSYLNELADDRYVSVFTYRDPRDRIISFILYAMNIHKGHQLRDYYLDLPSMEDRIDSTILGISGMLPSIRQVYDSYTGWLNVDRVLSISFESLVTNQRAAVEQLIDHLKDGAVPIDRPIPEMLAVLEDEMSPRRSPTYRSGQTGEWRTHFTEANVRQFKKVAGDLLIELGYEQSDDWGVNPA
jgi:hypothetical protein